ncbi:MAG: hypothetical protein U5O15_11095 [Candidatus Krumholzibacteriota bacterium]|nr:hypothetical protein [Candidatus Krumholzibacteriota bacterium]
MADLGDTRLRIDLPVAEAVQLDPGARVALFLDVAPLERVPATLTRASYEATTTPDDVLAYRVYADFAADAAPRRPGLKGTAKLFGPEVPLALYLFRRPVSAVRQRGRPVSAPALTLPGAGAAAGELPERLPPLRADLELLEAPRAADGSPCWTIHDPVLNSFYRIGDSAFRLLSNWALGAPEAVLARANRAAQSAPVTARQLEQLLRFLAANQLIEAAGPQGLADHLARLDRRRTRPWQWLLHRYLFFRVPLVRPDAVLGATLHLVRLMTRGFWRPDLPGAGARWACCWRCGSGRPSPTPS